MGTLALEVYSANERRDAAVLLRPAAVNDQRLLDRILGRWAIRELRILGAIEGTLAVHLEPSQWVVAGDWSQLLHKVTGFTIRLDLDDKAPVAESAEVEIVDNVRLGPRPGEPARPASDARRRGFCQAGREASSE